MIPIPSCAVNRKFGNETAMTLPLPSTVQSNKIRQLCWMTCPTRSNRRSRCATVATRCFGLGSVTYISQWNCLLSGQSMCVIGKHYNYTEKDAVIHPYTDVTKSRSSHLWAGNVVLQICWPRNKIKNHVTLNVDECRSHGDFCSLLINSQFWEHYAKCTSSSKPQFFSQNYKWQTGRVEAGK